MKKSQLEDLKTALRQGDIKRATGIVDYEIKKLERPQPGIYKWEQGGYFGRTRVDTHGSGFSCRCAGCDSRGRCLAACKKCDYELCPF